MFDTCIMMRMMITGGHLSYRGRQNLHIYTIFTRNQPTELSCSAERYYLLDGVVCRVEFATSLSFNKFYKFSLFNNHSTSGNDLDFRSSAIANTRTFASFALFV
jgi:hypothetical protein